MQARQPLRTRIDPERLRQVSLMALMFWRKRPSSPPGEIKWLRKVAQEPQETQSLVRNITVFANQPHGFVQPGGAGGWMRRLMPGSWSAVWQPPAAT
jgi:hypothetical protein